MNEDPYKFWKCAILYFGCTFRHLTDKHFTENFNPTLLHNDFIDIYNNLLKFNKLLDLYNYMREEVMEYSRRGLLCEKLYSKIYNKAHDKRISKYKEYFDEKNYPNVSYILQFPQKIMNSKKYIPLELNDFLGICGILDLPDIIGVYFYSYFQNTKFTGRENKTRLRSCIEDINKINTIDPFLFWKEIAKIDITNIDYPPYPNNIDELTNIEKQTNKFPNISFKAHISMYGEKNALDVIYDLRVNNYYAIKITETEYIQNIIVNINKIIINIYELFKNKCSELIFYPLGIVVNIDEEICFNNKVNNKYISPIFFEELENNMCYKMSDGFCYSVNELYGFKEYISPLTRQPLNKKDIDTIKYIKSNYINMLVK
jgi:hypothetical protein